MKIQQLVSALLLSTFLASAHAATVSIVGAGGNENSATEFIQPFANTNPGNTDVVVLGVYQGLASLDGTISVSIDDAGAAPLTLVLSSNLSVTWNLDIEQGVNLNEVWVYGIQPQTVNGFAGTITTGFPICGYSWPDDGQGCDTEGLMDEVAFDTGLATTLFAGTLEASGFNVETSAVVVPVPASGILFLSAISMLLARLKRR